MGKLTFPAFPNPIRAERNYWFLQCQNLYSELGLRKRNPVIKSDKHFKAQFVMFGAKSQRNQKLHGFPLPKHQDFTIK